MFPQSFDCARARMQAKFEYLNETVQNLKDMGMDTEYIEEVLSNANEILEDATDALSGDISEVGVDEVEDLIDEAMERVEEANDLLDDLRARGKEDDQREEHARARGD